MWTLASQCAHCHLHQSVRRVHPTWLRRVQNLLGYPDLWCIFIAYMASNIVVYMCSLPFTSICSNSSSSMATTRAKSAGLSRPVTKHSIPWYTRLPYTWSRGEQTILWQRRSSDRSMRMRHIFSALFKACGSVEWQLEHQHWKTFGKIRYHMQLSFPMTLFHSSSTVKFFAHHHYENSSMSPFHTQIMISTLYNSIAT